MTFMRFDIKDQGNFSLDLKHIKLHNLLNPEVFLVISHIHESILQLQPAPYNYFPSSDKSTASF